MSSFEEIRHKGITEARTTLENSAYKQRLLSAFEKWWRDQDGISERDSVPQASHPPAERLADELRTAGMEGAAQFATGRWVKQGPIHCGTWLFAILLGESLVGAFTDALVAGSWRSLHLFGLDTFGAWESFYCALRERLRCASEVADAAMSRLVRSAQDTTRDPLGSLGPTEDRGNLRDRITQYGTSPDIEEAWKHPYDPPFLLDDTFLRTALLEVRPAETLALIGGLPHPAFMRNCLGYRWMVEYPELVGSLIRAAPVAFDSDGKFQSSGAVALQLLETAADALEQIRREAEDDIVNAGTIDRPELLEPVVERCRAYIKDLLECLFSRRDAIPLAWAWLDRMVFLGEAPGARHNGRTFAVNLSKLLIRSVAQCLRCRADWKGWTLQQKGLWRVNRLVGVLAVQVFGATQDTKVLNEILEWLFFDSDFDCPVLNDAIGNDFNVFAAIGGCAIAAFPDPAAWVTRMWQKLRPIRERNWRTGARDGKHNGRGELLVVWGVAAYGLLAPEQQKAMWTCLEKCVRDAWQTDTFGYAPVWSRALLLLFDKFQVSSSESSESTAEQLADALLPYIASDYGFLIVVLSLVDRKRWSLETIQEAVASAGFDLARLVIQYLEMKELVHSLPQANKQEIGSLRELAATLSVGLGQSEGEHVPDAFAPGVR